MLIFIMRRVGAMVLTMLVVSVLLFVLLEFTPGNVAAKVLGPYSSEEQREIWLEKNGYNDPLPVRYGRWLWNAVQLDFGQSIKYKTDVSEVLWPRLGNTAILGAATMAVVIPLALVLGVLSGMREGSTTDRSISIVSILTTSVPEFASAPMLQAIFVFYLAILPGTSSMIGGFNPVELILPVMVLVLYDFGYVTRMTRASMAEVMMTHYIRTAVLKGLPYKLIMLQINWLLSGVIVVEFFFAYKGFGFLILDASLNQDIFMIEACAMVAVFVAVATQALADIGYTYLNPRIRFS